MAFIKDEKARGLIKYYCYCNLFSTQRFPVKMRNKQKPAYEKQLKKEQLIISNRMLECRTITGNLDRLTNIWKFVRCKKIEKNYFDNTDVLTAR